jgi:tetratricopeptide (TPR) repeat protein
MDKINTLLDKSAAAREKNDWKILEENSIKILQILQISTINNEVNLYEIVRNYLSSIIGTGSFLSDLNSVELTHFKSGLDKLEKFIKNQPHYLKTVDPLVSAGREIVLLALEPTTANKNKISKNLRKIARPDLAIEICSKILSESRLNYYALTILCAAYCDVYQFDKAIEFAETALKFAPNSEKTYTLNAIARAHTHKFKTTGDFADIDLALKYAHESIDLKLDSYSANTLMAAAVASPYDSEKTFAQEMLELAEPEISAADINAMMQAYKASEYLPETNLRFRVFDEFEEDNEFGKFDSLFDLVLTDQGFSPHVVDVRGALSRFKSGGWFLQGLCNVPCPKCETISLHSYRKHYGRYGKDFHYWALVCDLCKTATDSKEYDRKQFTFISSDLDENFPVEMLCDRCGV